MSAEASGEPLVVFHSAVQGIAELRNQLGFASHGTDRPRPSMENYTCGFGRASGGHPCWVSLPYPCSGQDSFYCDRIFLYSDSRVRRIHR